MASASDIVADRPWPVRLLRALFHDGGAILGLIAVAMLWVGIGYHLHQEREQAERAATQNTANLARAFEENLIRTLKAVDQTLIYVREAYAKDPAGFDMAMWAQSGTQLGDITFQITVADKDGLVVASSLGPPKTPVSLADREHFIFQKDMSRDELFISKPVLGRVSQKWSINLTRRITARDGTFGGMVVVSLDPYYLSRFYEAVDIGGRGVVALFGTDGVVRARSSLSEDAIGQTRSDSPVLERVKEAPAGSYSWRSRSDGIERIYSYRLVKGYPLVVVVGFAQDEVLAIFTSNRASYLSTAAILTVILLAVTVLIGRHQARLTRTREELRASEQAQAQKSEMLQRTLETMSQGIMMIDAERRVQVLNSRAVELLGLPAELAVEPSFDAILEWQWRQGEFASLGDANDGDDALRRFIAAGGIADKEQVYERQRPNGVVLEVRSIPMPGGGTVRTYTDITLRKEAEEALRRGRDEAESAARTKSEFLATMSHEIRSPMNGLLGIIELLRDTKLDKEQAGMVELVHTSASSLLGVLNDVLDFSKIEAGAMSTSPEPHPVADLVSSVLAPFQVGAQKKGLELVAKVARDVPDVVVLDPLRTRQILVNLVSNAVKFTPTGSVTLDVMRDRGADGATMLAFSVTDTGVGVAPEQLARLFEPFTQADGSITRNFGGSGLGLSISRKLARMQGGDLTATSVAGAGSVFKLSLPLVEGVMPQPEPETAMVPGDGGRFRGRRVLVAEDSQTNRWLLQRQLERFGCQVVTVEDGFGALEALQAATFDLLITDGHMPGMDGATLARQVREKEALTGAPRMPILGLTADVTSTMRDSCQAAGMDDIESKPINLQRLEAALGSLLQSDAMPVVEAPAEPQPANDFFDPTTYHELFGPDEPDGKEWLEGFRTAAATLVETVRKAVADNDRETMRASTHRLAGTALSAGATRLGALCRRFEAAAPGGSAAEIAALLAELEEAQRQSDTAIARFIQGLPEAA